MGRSHAMCGVIFGIGVFAVLDHAPLPVRLLAIPVAGGAALLPDIDHPSSRIARSLGLVTRVIAQGVAWLSEAVYYATRTEADKPSCHGGHRTLTHTIPGCLGFGVITGVTEWVHPVAGAVVLTLLCGLLAQGFRSIGVGFTLTGAAGSWFVMDHYPGWWWVWPLLVTLGSFVHILGDTVTNSGTPMWWPLLRGGRRWGKVRTPATFSTGEAFEAEVVTPLLALSLVAASALALGLPQAAYHSWAVSHGA